MIALGASIGRIGDRTFVSDKERFVGTAFFAIGLALHGQTTTRNFLENRVG